MLQPQCQVLDAVLLLREQCPCELCIVLPLPLCRTIVNPVLFPAGINHVNLLLQHIILALHFISTGPNSYLGNNIRSRYIHVRMREQ